MPRRSGTGWLDPNSDLSRRAEQSSPSRPKITAFCKIDTLGSGSSYAHEASHLNAIKRLTRFGLDERSHVGVNSPMPIRRQLRWLYPIDWPQISAAVRFTRAGGRCEHCGRPHGRTIVHLGDGRWWDEQAGVWRSGKGRVLSTLVAPVGKEPGLPTTKVSLATAHLDHDPGNNRPRNLKALCQRCHMLHDGEEHRRRRWLTLRMRKAMGDLFSDLTRWAGDTEPLRDERIFQLRAADRSGRCPHIVATLFNVATQLST